MLAMHLHDRQERRVSHSGVRSIAPVKAQLIINPTSHLQILSPKEIFVLCNGLRISIFDSQMKNLQNQQQITERIMIQVPYSQIGYYQETIIRLQTQLRATRQQLADAKIRIIQSQERSIKDQLLIKDLSQMCNKLKVSRLQHAHLAKEDHQFAAQKIVQAQNQLKNRFEIKEQELKQYYQALLEKSKNKVKQFKKEPQSPDQTQQKINLLQFKLEKAISQKRELLREFDDYKEKTQRQRTNELQDVRQSLAAKNKEKQENDRIFYREQAQNLQNEIRKLEEKLNDALIKADPNRQRQIDRLKQEIRNNVIANAQELDKFAALLGQKNRQISKLSEERVKLQNALLQQRQQSRQRFKNLQNQLMKNQLECQKQLRQTTLKMSAINEQTIRQLKQQIQQAAQNFFNQRKGWENVIQQKNHQVNQYKKAWEDQKLKAKQQKQYMKSKISQLKERLEQYEGSKHGGQTQLMLNDLKQQDQKKQHFDNYENGVTFLERQVKKSILKLESKNIELKNTLKEMNQMRQQFNKDKQYAKNKFQSEKKNLMSRILGLQDTIEELHEKIRQKMIDQKLRNNSKDQDWQRLEGQNRGLKQLTNQLQRDYNRVIQTKKQVQRQHRQQREQGIQSKSIIQFTKRDKWLQLQRQRNQLQVSYKQKQQQLRMAHEVERDRWRHLNQNLKGQIQLIRQQNSTMNQKIKQVQGIDYSKAQKVRIAEYNKKAAAINLEIALNTNIYKAISNVKSGGVYQFGNPNLSLSQIDQIKSQSAPMDTDRRKQLQKYLQKQKERTQKQGSMSDSQHGQSPAFKNQQWTNFGIDSFGPLKIQSTKRERKPQD